MVKKSCRVYHSQQYVGALWAGCPFTRREENLFTELSGHVANMPALLMGNCTLEDDDIS